MIDLLRNKHGARSGTNALVTVFMLFACILYANASLAGDDKNTISIPEAYAESGTITYCPDFTNPPREFYRDGQRAGADVDLAQAMADVLGLRVKWTQLKFAALIPALQSGQCDMIVGELFIKPERQEVIDFIPYTVSGEQIVVRK